MNIVGDPSIPMIIVCSCILIPIATMIAYLFFFQLSLIWKNVTTIEYREDSFLKYRYRIYKRRLREDVEYGQVDSYYNNNTTENSDNNDNNHQHNNNNPPPAAPRLYNPYNLGVHYNLYQFFGKGPTEWFLPSKQQGNGVLFRTITRALEGNHY